MAFTQPITGETSAAKVAAEDAAAATSASVAVTLGLSIDRTFPAAATDTIKERISFPYGLSQVSGIAVCSIGVRGTGTIKVSNGIAGSGNSMLNSDFDVSTLAADDAIEGLTLTSTEADLQGTSLQGLTLEFVNCTVPHLIKIKFQEQ